MEVMLPQRVQALREQNPHITDSQIHAAIYKDAALEALRWMDCGEEFINQVLAEFATPLN
jgi:hypothetical protein